ncbi:MAG: isocitrate/isopropylmalate family dehydrogenase, partial [Gammaproteobacteria bacterium]|nr:isocitrate/isopropylmalate family dehydrogenase [Gammaproteobacteria bacterium]
MSRKIAILPGDGIGLEIIAEAEKMLRCLQHDFGLDVETETAAIGGAGFDQFGHPLPESTLALCRQSDAILFGSIGGPQYDSLDRELRPERGLLGLRSSLELFSNLRPAMLYPQLASASSLKPEIVSGLDIMIVRELTGGIYFGQPRGIRDLENGERQGFNTLVYA